MKKLCRKVPPQVRPLPDTRHVGEPWGHFFRRFAAIQELSKAIHGSPCMRLGAPVGHPGPLSMQGRAGMDRADGGA